MLYVIEKPLVTEKTSRMAENNIYAFHVNIKAGKLDIREAIEKSFRVKVQSVKTVICRGRAKKTKHGYSKVPHWKKAFVKLSKGEKISLFEGV